jgi:hypothetical protein
LLDGCNEVGDSIVIETKINTVEGIISYIDTKGQIKIKYNALDAGYTSGYQLDNCEIEAIRCFVCCDDRYYELTSCELTTEALNALFGEDKPEGKIFAYSGDRNEPDCLYKYSGLGDFLDPDNWSDEYGRISSQLEDMPEDQLAQFVNWLSEIFEGNGISFNANAEDGKVVVTVIGDGYVGASSFVVSYEDGYIHFNAGDGSGLKTSMIVEHGDGPPSEPYDWFSYINDLTGAFYINNNGEPMLLGVLEGSDLDTCNGIVNCINHNLANPPQQDIYALPELDGAPWVINQVTYGEPLTLVVDFSACSGTNLDDLVLELNSCSSNPLGWVWVNSGGVLKVCVAPGTNILTISFGSPLQVVNFNGNPTTPGDDYPDLCKEISECLQTRGLLAGMTKSFSTTELAIQAEYNTQIYAFVKWVDSDGDDRLSYKDPINGWYHPVKKAFKAGYEILVYSAQRLGLPTAAPLIYSQSINLVSLGVPSDAKFIDLQMTVKVTRTSYRPAGATPEDVYCSLEVFSTQYSYAGSRIVISSHDDVLRGFSPGESKEQKQKITMPMNSNGLLRVDNNAANGAASQSTSYGDYIATLYLVGWSR